MRKPIFENKLSWPMATTTIVIKWNECAPLTTTTEVFGQAFTNVNGPIHSPIETIEGLPLFWEAHLRWESVAVFEYILNRRYK